MKHAVLACHVTGTCIHSLDCVLLLLMLTACRFTQLTKKQKTTRGQEGKSSRNVAFVILFTEMKSHLSVRICASEKQKGDEVCCMLESRA